MAHGHNTLLAGLGGTLGGMVVYQMGGQTVMRRRAYRQSGPGTAAQRGRRGAFADLAHAWRGLSAIQQAAWAMLGARMPDWDAARPSGRLSGYQCWLIVGTGRRALGLAPTPDAPFAPEMPPFLPPLTLTAGRTGGALSLVLSCGDAPFDAPVQILAWRPSSPLDAPPRLKDAVQVALLPALPAGGADFGPAYALKYGVPAPGQSVTLRAAPLSPTGFRGQPLSVSGIMTP